MPKVSEKHLAARKQQIFSAATRQFSRRGFHQTSIQDICDEAGLSAGAVYRYFKNKEDLISQIAVENRQRNLALVEEIDRAESAREKMRRLIETFFGMLDKDGCPVRMDIELWAEALRNPRIMRIVRQSLNGHHSAFVRIVEQGQRDGEIRTDIKPEAMARMMISMFTGLLLQKGLLGEVETWDYVNVINALNEALFSAVAAR